LEPKRRTTDQNQCARGRSPAANSARIGDEGGFHEERISGIGCRKLGHVAEVGEIGPDGIDDGGAAHALVNRDEDHRRAVPHDQDRRQDQRRDVCNGALNRLDLEAGALARAFDEGGRELAVDDRKSRDQRLTTG